MTEGRRGAPSECGHANTSEWMLPGELAGVPGPLEVPRVIGCTQQQGDRATKNGFIVTKSGPEQENTGVG